VRRTLVVLGQLRSTSSTETPYRARSIAIRVLWGRILPGTAILATSREALESPGERLRPASFASPPPNRRTGSDHGAPG